MKDHKLNVVSQCKRTAYVSGSQGVFLAELITLSVLWERVHSLVPLAHVCLLSLLISFSAWPFSSSKPATMAQASSFNMTPSFLAPTVTVQGQLMSNPVASVTLAPFWPQHSHAFQLQGQGKGPGGSGSRSVLCLTQTAILLSHCKLIFCVHSKSKS